MSEPTPRDRAWLVLVEHLREHESIQSEDITDTAGVSVDTARAVLNVAEDADPALLRRDSPRAQTWWPAIGPLGEVSDPEYRRLFADLLAEKRE